MHKKWNYRVNQIETLVNDLTHLGAPLPKCHSTSMHCNNKMELRWAINMIQEEKNRMGIRRNRYYMLCEVHRQAKEVNIEVDPIVITEINSKLDCSSNIEVSDEEKYVYHPCYTAIINIKILVLFYQYMLVNLLCWAWFNKYVMVIDKHLLMLVVKEEEGVRGLGN